MSQPTKPEEHAARVLPREWPRLQSTKQQRSTETIVTGHQHIAEPAAVRITKSTFLWMAIRIAHPGIYGHLLTQVPSDLQGVARTVWRQCISRPPFWMCC